MKNLPPHIVKKLIDDPSFFALTVFDVWLWSKQREVVNALKKYDKIAVYSATGTGKSFLQAVLVVWFLQTRPNNLISLLSPNFKQLKRSVWRVVIDLYNKSRIKLYGEPTSSIWKIPERNAQAEPLSYRRIEAIQGLHEEHMLFLLEESSGLEEVVWNAVYGNMTGGRETKLIAFGNPLYPKGEYYKTLFDPTFHKINISVFDTPNFTGEIDEIPEPYRTKLKYVLPNKKYVEDVEKKYGKNSNYWKAKILGQFPDTVDDGLFSINSINECIEMPEFEERNPACLTIDVARGGVHSTVIAVWEGYNLVKFIEVRKNTFPELTQHIINIARDYNPEWITLDTTGSGIGLYDFLAQDLTIPVYGVNFNENAVDEELYANIRTEMYFNLADAIKNKRVKLPDYEELKNELLAQRYEFDRDRRFILIEKKKIEKELGRSPDYADATALRFVRTDNRVGIALI